MPFHNFSNLEPGASCQKKCTAPYSSCVIHNGSEERCECPQNCPKVMEQVCGSDKVIYNNKCLLEKAACENNKEIAIVETAQCRGISVTLYTERKCTLKWLVTLSLRLTKRAKPPEKIPVCIALSGYVYSYSLLGRMLVHEIQTWRQREALSEESILPKAQHNNPSQLSESGKSGASLVLRRAAFSGNLIWPLLSSGKEWDGVAGRHLVELNGLHLFILPGHPWLLHSLVALLGPSPWQSSPPLEGGGLVHVLFRVCTPPPQVFEHTPYGFQSE